MSSLQNIDAMILCGGLGTRFQKVMSDCPKGLAEVAGKSILERLIDNLVDQGITRVVLCVGHLSSQIIDFFKDRNDIEILFSTETEPLGTAGALKNALPLVISENLLVMNGDSLCSIKFSDLHDFHQKQKSFLTIVISPSEDTKDYGNITLNEMNRILSFNEKVGSGSVSFINAGIYLMSLEALEQISNNFPVSLEVDFFPEIIKKEFCFGYTTNSMVMDIGTPDRYQKINKIFKTSNSRSGGQVK